VSSVALVVPCFNEARRLDTEYWNSISAMSNVSLVFVNDGSSDRTADLLGEFSATQNSEVLTHPKNLGKAEAIRTGLQHLVSGDSHLVGFIDADAAVPVHEVQRCIDLARSVLQHDEMDCLWASRVALAGRNIDRSAYRHYTGRIIATLVSKGLEGFPYDSQCGFKLFKNCDSFGKAIEKPFLTKWFVDIEIMQRWHACSSTHLRIYEEPLWEWADQPGGNLTAKNAFSVMKEVFAIRSLSRQLAKPETSK